MIFLHECAVLLKLLTQFLGEKVHTKIAFHNTLIGEISQTVFYQRMLFKVIDYSIGS